LTRLKGTVHPKMLFIHPHVLFLLLCKTKGDPYKSLIQVT